MRDGERVALLAAVLLNLTGLLYAFSCPMEIEPPHIVVAHGGSLSVRCRALTTELDRISVETAYGGQTEGNGSVTWSWKNVTNYDIDVLCFINMRKPENQCTREIHVTVYKHPESVILTDTEGGSGAAGDLDEGVPRRFLCDVSDVAPVQNISVTWLIGNRTVQYDDTFAGSKEPEGVQSFFSYEPRRQDDGLHITCQVTFDLGASGPQTPQISQGHPLRIRYPPETITQLVEDEDLEVGSSTTLKCFSNAYPAATYHWDYYKTGNVEVEWSAGGSSLLINNATDVNIGHYTCTAANELKNVSHTARVTVKGADSQCPIEMTPERLVMAYGGQRSVTCVNSTEDASRNVIALNWRVGARIVPGPRWDIQENEDWAPRAECIATFSGIGECSKPFDVTFYKTADQVVIRPVGHGGTVVADTEFQLQCDVVNVAPVQNLTVRWYKDGDLLKVQDQVSLRVTGCPHQNQVDCDTKVIRSPVNVSSTIRVRLEKGQDGAEFSCEAQLALEQQPPPPMRSHSLNLTVHYKPIINSTKLRSRISVFKGHPAQLVCEAEGRPTPDVDWFSETGVHVSGGNLTASKAGVWTCFATNVVGSSLHVVEVTVLWKETADQVVIRPVGHGGTVVADTETQLQCDFINVATVQNLTVRWYKDGRLLNDQGLLRVTGCPHQNQVDCDTQVIRSPVNVSSTIKVRLGKKQDGAEFSCEAQLALEQQPPPPMRSHSLNLTVHYEPIINSTKLPSRVPVFKGYPAELVCEAEGRPAPDIHWSSEKVRISGGNLTAKAAGVWTCYATNVVGSRNYSVEVVMKVDYLPLIAGFVAATVLIISAVFVFFYSIYYKNTKMRRYSLKNPKLSALNGNVAHTSWESPLPMTKLS